MQSEAITQKTYVDIYTINYFYSRIVNCTIVKLRKKSLSSIICSRTEIRSRLSNPNVTSIIVSTPPLTYAPVTTTN